MNIVDRSYVNEWIEVQVTRKVKVGQTLKINPSEAYLGIESGNIKVLAFVPTDPDSAVEYTSEVHTENIIRDMDEFKRVEYADMDISDGMDSKPWVVYKYLSFHKSADTEWAVLPLEMFIEHTMMY